MMAMICCTNPKHNRPGQRHHEAPSRTSQSFVLIVVPPPFQAQAPLLLEALATWMSRPFQIGMLLVCRPGVSLGAANNEHLHSFSTAKVTGHSLGIPWGYSLRGAQIYEEHTSA